MKQFLIQVLIFCGLVTAIFGGLFFVSNKIISSKTDYKISDNIDKLIIGHSHPECAYNDSLIDNFKNFSASGEAYFYNYYKLIPLLEHNENIKTVLVEYTNNQINENMNSWTWDSDHLPFKYGLFGLQINAEGKKLLFEKNPKGFINAQFFLLKNNIENILHRQFYYKKGRGGFIALNRNKLSEEIKRQSSVDTTKKYIINTSEYNVEYLKKIVTLCQSKNIKVYFVRSPMHKKYIGDNTEPVYQNLLHTKFNGIELLDFKNYPLADSAFADTEHLNYKGAKIYSIWFNQLLKEGLLDSTNKQAFIDKRMSN